MFFFVVWCFNEWYFIIICENADASDCEKYFMRKEIAPQSDHMKDYNFKFLKSIDYINNCKLTVILLVCFVITNFTITSFGSAVNVILDTVIFICVWTSCQGAQWVTQGDVGGGVSAPSLRRRHPVTSRHPLLTHA